MLEEWCEALSVIKNFLASLRLKFQISEPVIENDTSRQKISKHRKIDVITAIATHVEIIQRICSLNFAASSYLASEYSLIYGITKNHKNNKFVIFIISNNPTMLCHQNTTNSKIKSLNQFKTH